MSPQSAQSERWLQAALEAAHIGGRVLQEWAGRFTVREKSRANLVTEADEASQAAIVSYLQRVFPDHGYLGEENLNRRQEGTSESESFWIIDPLDGTSNYVHGFPYFAVSIALYAQGRLQVGVIYDPTRGEMFAARAGCGATLNGAAIESSGECEIGRAMGVASLPIAADPENPAVKRFLKALTRMQTVQRTGSAALNLAYLAAGRIDAFWSSSLNSWDVAAGVLIVQEAGGTVTGLKGGPIDIFLPDLLAAASPTLHHQLVTELS
jgi:myo-inositol-1(or 4)-monophosphatase